MFNTFIITIGFLVLSFVFIVQLENLSHLFSAGLKTLEKATQESVKIAQILRYSYHQYQQNKI